MSCAATPKNCARFSHFARRLIDEPEVQLVDERGRLHAVVRALAQELALRQPMQLRVDGREEPVESLRVPGIPREEQARDVRIARGRVRHRPLTLLRRSRCHGSLRNGDPAAPRRASQACRPARRRPSPSKQNEHQPRRGPRRPPGPRSERHPSRRRRKGRGCLGVRGRRPSLRARSGRVRGRPSRPRPVRANGDEGLAGAGGEAHSLTSYFASRASNFGFLRSGSQRGSSLSSGTEIQEGCDSR